MSLVPVPAKELEDILMMLTDHGTISEHTLLINGITADMLEVLVRKKGHPEAGQRVW